MAASFIEYVEAVKFFELDELQRVWGGSYAAYHEVLLSGFLSGSRVSVRPFPASFGVHDRPWRLSWVVDDL